MEHRCGTRYPVDVPAYVRTRDELASGFGRLREVSASGGFIETRLDVQPLSRLTVQLLTSWHAASAAAGAEAHPAPLIIEAQVIRLGLQGLYIEWTEYAPDLVRHLTEPRESGRLAEPNTAAAQSKEEAPAVLAPLAESLGLLELRD